MTIYGSMSFRGEDTSLKGTILSSPPRFLGFLRFHKPLWLAENKVLVQILLTLLSFQL